MPLLVCVVMLAHVILLNLGFDAIIAEIIEVCLGFTAVWLMSKSLGYCFTHRLQIAYAYIVTVCIWWQRWTDGFGEYLTEARVFLIIVGVLILVISGVMRCKK